MSGISGEALFGKGVPEGLVWIVKDYEITGDVWPTVPEMSEYGAPIGWGVSYRAKLHLARKSISMSRL